jgi:hypothetical protein
MGFGIGSLGFLSSFGLGHSSLMFRSGDDPLETSESQNSTLGLVIP